jgi:hypothetical protein
VRPASTPLSLVLAAVALAAALAGCSSSGGSSSGGADGGASCSAYDPGPLVLSAPAVSLKTDVMPGVFAKSCSLSASCHGAPTGSQQGLFLGKPSLAGADSSAVRATLLGASTELPTAKLVVPGDPARSYLLGKMDGDQCRFTAACVGGSCGSSMPSGSDVLPAATRDIVRRWIAQGAQDN